jgi:dienelactone hydrolase
MHVVGIGAGGCCAFLHVVHRVDQGGLVAFAGGLILDMMLMLVYVALSCYNS